MLEPLGRQNTVRESRLHAAILGSDKDFVGLNTFIGICESKRIALVGFLGKLGDGL